MSHAYRKDRYSYANAERKEKWIKVVIVFLALLICIGIIGVQWKLSKDQQASAEEQLLKITKFEEELRILRTLNPYQVPSNEVLAKAVEQVDLFPGWIARVYPLPKQRENIALMNDLGSFVLNETKFSLSSHNHYGIPQLNKGMYRLNGLYPNKVTGRLQVAIELYLASDKSEGNYENASKICSCYVRIDMNGKRVIDKKIHMVTRFQDEQMIMGDVQLKKGLHPISATLYCDESSDFSGEQVKVAISFRGANQPSLSSSRHSIFHIYKPGNMVAKL